MTLSEAYKKLARSFKNGVYLKPVNETSWERGGEIYLTKGGILHGLLPDKVSKPSTYLIIEQSLRETGVKNAFRLTSSL